MYKLYVITNLINGKMYVGQTSGTVKHRWSQHKSHSRTRPHLPLYASMLKHGVENFDVSLVALAFTKEHCDWLEEQWIRTLETHLRDKGYNLTYGGEGARHTPETREKLSKMRIGKPGRVYTEEQRLETSIRQRGEKGNNWGKKASPETAEKMSQAHSGENNHCFGLYGPFHPAFGAKHSEESKRIRSEKLSGTNNPMYGRKGALSPTFGRKHSEEAKRKLSEIAKARRATKNNSVQIA